MGPTLAALLATGFGIVLPGEISKYRRDKKAKKEKKRYEEGKGSKDTDALLDLEYELSKEMGYPPDERSMLEKFLEYKATGRLKPDYTKTWAERQEAKKDKPWILRSKGGELGIDNSGQVKKKRKRSKKKPRGWGKARYGSK
jgi:hypothetical protein